MENKEGLGIAMKFQTGASFEIISIGLHYHTDGDDTCMFRWGIYFVLCGIEVAIGKFRT